VLFHCSAGHDRTGIVAAYMRLKYQHWPVDQAIDEMRRYGHNWPKFSHDGGTSSWHEEHLRAIDKLLSNAAP
jgi:protein-tyrosine phosphatase family protein